MELTIAEKQLEDIIYKVLDMGLTEDQEESIVMSIHKVLRELA